MGTQHLEEVAHVVLEQDDEGDGSHLDQLVEDGSQQTHLQHLSHQQPQQDEDKDACENLYRA